MQYWSFFSPHQQYDGSQRRGRKHGSPEEDKVQNPPNFNAHSKGQTQVSRQLDNLSVKPKVVQKSKIASWKHTHTHTADKALRSQEQAEVAESRKMSGKLDSSEDKDNVATGR